MLDLEPHALTGKVALKDLVEGTFTLPVLLARGRDPSIQRLVARLTALPRAERGRLAREVADRVRRAGGLERARGFARALALGARTALLSRARPRTRRATRSPRSTTSSSRESVEPPPGVKKSEGPVTIPAVRHS